MKKYEYAAQMIIVGITATIIGYLLNLEYWFTAGVIAILSINLTKLDTIKVAFNRVIGVFSALSIATILFVLLGYHLWVYFIILTIFILLMWLVNKTEGIVVSLVLTNQLLLANQFSWAVLLNAIAIFLIAVFIALIVNLFFPNTTKNKIFKQTNQIDFFLRENLFAYSLLLKDPEGYQIYLEHSNKTQALLSQVLKEAELYQKDQILTKDFDYSRYLKMRQDQFFHLKRMYGLVPKIKTKEPSLNALATLVSQISYDIGFENKAVYHLTQLTEFKQSLKDQPLPTNRVEFEMISIIFLIINELEEFLLTKIIYHES